MFGELQLKTFQVEVILGDYLVRAKFQPRGAMLVYLSDRQRPFLPFDDVEIYPLAVERQVNCVKQPNVIFNKSYLKLLSLPDEEDAKGEQILASKRPVAIYIGAFAIRGQLHVNEDARDQDLLDETKDFFAISEASIYPLRKVATPPTRHVPLLYISRVMVQGYHVVEGK
jgi:hypothetical protein